MAMPEASMHKDDLTLATKNKVWATWKPPIVQAVAIAQAMRETTDDHFRLGVLAAHSPHPFGSGLR